ncbi:hypothetical protein O6H91_05G048000 [Diphasiastrum complanatum]|uniref:Uncharacterized protein n=1 Tax=Diphasiastrum complanatum TaxID=34168 RepID=A0ACC2DMY3_DIPCM|nr:hypothetical protein O6H91_05G048000 [Diphasiastrum complanatum]
MEPLPPDHSHNPMALASWARRTGYKSGQNSSASGDMRETTHVVSTTPTRLGKVKSSENPKEVIKKEVKPENGATIKTVMTIPIKDSRPAGKKVPDPEIGVVKMEKQTKDYISTDIDTASDHSQEGDDIFAFKQAQMKYEIRDTPGLVPLILYGLQHYFSIIGSIILVPLAIVPAMGGSDNDAAKVISTTLLVCGVTTLLHSAVGSRLPLIQGPSFAYLAPSFIIISSFQGLHFKDAMKELQGAIIISSAFQILLGYSGLMSLLLRFINPVVVAPTVAAIGLAFFSYGFPKVGSCLEIGIPEIIIVIIFSLYLRKISIFGHRIFQVYAIPLGLIITWAYAFLLTQMGAYKYKGCPLDASLQKSISEECQRHIYTMKHCRTDTSHAMKAAAWFRFPYPFQWGVPTFHWQTGIIMIVASIIASVDSIGSYHATSLLVASKAPTPGIVSRSIGLEGITSALAGMWGIGTGATTLTENVHTIAVTKMGSRRPVILGACVLIVLSVIGKVGGFIASIPQVIVAALLCIMWAMQAAWGLSNLRYSETGSSRNVLIVGLSLFLSLSVPAYFQQYGVPPSTTTSLSQPYTVAAHGPIRTSIKGVNFVLNSALSMHMAIAFIVAFILDNSVPGSRRERGVYVWSRYKAIQNEPAVIKDYSLPFGMWKLFSWAKWVGF